MIHGKECYGYTKGMKENDSYTKGISSKHENNVKKKMRKIEKAAFRGIY